MIKDLCGVKGQGHIVGSAIKLLPICFTSVGHAIPEMEVFTDLSFKIQGLGHGQGQN